MTHAFTSACTKRLPQLQFDFRPSFGAGKPVVALFGPTEPRRTGPYGQLNRALQLELPCVPCMTDSCSFARPLECLRALAPETVAARVRPLLEGPLASGASLNSLTQGLVD